MRLAAEIKPLTGLRGVAASYVVLYHYWSFRSGIAADVLKHGYLAVDLFFVLSGFVMAMTYGGQFAAYRARAHLEFLLKRLGRVYPLYLVVTLACAGLAGLGLLSDTGIDPYTLICNVLLLQSWGLADSLNAPAWSISTELAAYLLFPGFALLVLFGSWRRAWVTATISALLLVLVATRSDAAIHQVVRGVAGRNGPLDVHDGRSLFPMIRCGSGFLLGLFAWRSLQLPAVRATCGRPPLQWGVLGLVIGLLGVPSCDVVEVLLFVPLIMSLAATTSGAGRLFSCAPVHWLGLISYSLYLVHNPLHQLSMLVFEAVYLRVSHAYLVIGSGLLVPALLLSSICFYAIEKPGRAWSRRLLEGWRRRNRLSLCRELGPKAACYGSWAQRRVQPAIQPASSPLGRGRETQ